MKRRTNPEQKLHKLIVTELRKLPNLMVLTYKNTGTMRDGVYCPSSTTILGVADLMIFPKLQNRIKRTSYKIQGTDDLYIIDAFLSESSPFFVELKAGKNKQQLHQVQFQIDVEKLGYAYYVVYSWQDMCAILEKRGLL